MNTGTKGIAEDIRKALNAATPRQIDEWHEDYGDVLWWTFPIEEPPYCGSPLDSDWPGYHTHWTVLIEPERQTELFRSLLEENTGNQQLLAMQKDVIQQLQQENERITKESQELESTTQQLREELEQVKEERDRWKQAENEWQKKASLRQL